MFFVTFLFFVRKLWLNVFFSQHHPLALSPFLNNSYTHTHTHTHMHISSSAQHGSEISSATESTSRNKIVCAPKRRLHNYDHGLPSIASCHLVRISLTISPYCNWKTFCTCCLLYLFYIYGNNELEVILIAAAACKVTLVPNCSLPT